MKTFISIVIIAVLAAVSDMLFVWWSVAVVAFSATFLLNYRPGRSFVIGFAGIALAWLIISLWCDIPNNHILSARMAILFHLPHYLLFILVIALTGGLVGGLAAWSGSHARRIFR